jgi:hypothetical protein
MRKSVVEKVHDLTDLKTAKDLGEGGKVEPRAA